MSLENEDLSSGYEIFGIGKEQSKTLYSREFLLSFSELDICKKLPSGFDPSILSEFEDAFHGVQERKRASSGSQLQGYRRSTEFSSSPPTRGDLGSHSRSSYGRWDTRSSGRSNQDNDFHSDPAEPGRHHMNPSRRPWQSSEHDGLLGTGSFPIPGDGSGSSSLKIRVTDDNHLNQINVPYQPPRPSKAAPYSRRGTKDSYNDETFGSSESATEDKVEEERQRRVAFELARREQHKVLQEKQKLKEEKMDLLGSNELHDSSPGVIPVKDSTKSAILSQTTSRPLVPPGFANAIGEKNSGLKPSVHTHKIEGTHPILLDTGTKMGSVLTFGVLEPKLPNGDNLFITTSVLDTQDPFDDPEVIGVIPKLSGSKAQGEVNRSQKTSILENIFGNTLPIDDSSSISLAEQRDGKPDDTWTPSSVQSSKFAHWFLEEEKKQGEDLSYGRPNDLLSLFVGGDKGTCQPSDEKISGQLPSGNSHKSSEFASELMFGLPSEPNENSNLQSESSKTEAISSVLTCEDLEQSILSEYSVKSLNLPLTEQSMQYSNINDAIYEQSRPVDNHASQQLLSLLHKDTGVNKMQLRSDTAIHLNDVSPSDEWDMQVARGETEEGLKSDPGSSTSTLEALFGSAFMRELQSARGPVSVQSGSVESAQTDVSEDLGLPFPLSTHVANNKIGHKSTSQGSKSLPPNHKQENRSESWLEISDSQDEPDLLKRLTGLNSNHTDVLEVNRCQLPEKERLITNGDPLNHPNSIIRPAGASPKCQLPSNAPINIVDKLEAIGAVVEEKSSMILPESSHFVHGSYNRIEPEILHRNLYAQFQNPLMNHERPLPITLDSHPARMNSHMKFIGPETMIHSDPSANNQLPANMMQISGNHSPQLLHRFQSTVLPPGIQPNALNSMQGFPFGPHRPHNMSSSGLLIPATNVNNGSNHPEAFQRLLEMERREKSKQIHPPPPGHIQAMYNNELDMGFRYK